jgi:hypothetical protein
MQWVAVGTRLRLLVGPVLALLLLTAATFGPDPRFQAPHAGADLEPVNGAEEWIQLLQGRSSILWASMDGTVSSYTIVGWPSHDGDSELAGALVISRPIDGSAGVIDFAEKPMSLRFDLSD